MRTDAYLPWSGRQRRPVVGHPWRWRFRLVCVLVMIGGGHRAEARPFRVSQIPNGNVFTCANCHYNPAGGGPRNPFGQAVEAITGTSGNPFWSPTLAQQDSDRDGAANGLELGDPDGDGAPTPGVTVFNPGDAASTPPPPPIQIAASAFKVTGPAATLQWAGGAPPFLVQVKANLADPSWRNVMTTSNRAAVVAAAGEAGYFRVGGNATNNVIPLTAWLSGEGEVPAVVTAGTGLGTFALEGNTLRYDVRYSGLTGDAQAAHIHGPATSTNAANVLYPLAGASGKAGLLSGTVVLSDVDKASLLAGKTYVNIHTSAQASGEIRGQIAPVRWTAVLSGGAEVPPVTTAGAGTGIFSLVGNQLQWAVTYQGLSAPATAAHIHGPATISSNAGVLVPLPGVSGTSGTVTGAVTLVQAALGHVIDGWTYVNVHTTNHVAGEIRGQIQPAP